MTELLVAGCSTEAARHAVMEWHYSKTMPVGRLLKLGVWEDSEFVGVVLFGTGANYCIGRPYELAGMQVCELVRVAMTAHLSRTSEVVARALKELHRLNPGLRLVVSYADPRQGHLGVLYQAGNWLYLGLAEATPSQRVRGEVLHRRTVFALYGTIALGWLREHVDPEAGDVQVPAKHCYVMPLDRAMRRQMRSRALPFPRGSGLHGEPSASPG